MIFKTTVNGIPCQCKVTRYRPYLPGTRHLPPQFAEFECEILDRRGRRAAWLDPYITQEVEDRLFEEHHIERQAQERELPDWY